MPLRHAKPPLPAWTWAYAVFRFGDGMTHVLISLAVVLHYQLPLWALAVTTACMNLAGVPGAFLWGRVMDRVASPRPFVIGGFALASLCMAVITLLPPFPVLLVAAAGFTVFGVATGPASSLMVLQGVRRPDWGRRTSRLSRRTGFGFLTGLALTTSLGFLDRVHFQETFAAGAALAAVAALLAARTIPKQASEPRPQAADMADADVIRASQRRFERPVYMPGRLRFVPGWRALREGLLRSHRLWPLGYAFTFMGSVAFFTSYPGILAGPEHLALGAGLVLLAQAPSHIVTPIVYPWAGRHGARVGETRGVVHGALLRMTTLPLLMLTIGATLAFDLPGTSVLLPLLVLHGLMGLSFALIQVNGPILLAESHPGGRGQGVGIYHAAVGSGTLTGSLIVFVLLRTLPFWASYVFAAAAGTLGGFLLFLAHRQHAALPPAEGAAGRGSPTVASNPTA